MAHTNSTTNYNLPIFIGSDKPAWLVDFNGAMNSIDTAIKDAADDASAAVSTASGASTAAGNAAAAAGQAQTTATNAANAAATNASAITALQNAVNSLQATVTALNNARHITSVTNSSGWRIERYSDGWVRMSYEGSVNFSTGSSSPLNGWYRVTQQITLPLTITSGGEAHGTGAVSGRLFIVTGLSGSNTLEALLYSGTAIPAGLTVTNATMIVEGYASA